MIERWFEDFMLLEKQSTPDDLGAEVVTYAPSTAFRGALTLIPGEESLMGGQPVLEERPVLLHDFDVTLVPGDHLRREKDGAIYRACGRTDAMRSPAWSGLNFAQVQVERVVLA